MLFWFFWKLLLTWKDVAKQFAFFFSWLLYRDDFPTELEVCNMDLDDNILES